MLGLRSVPERFLLRPARRGFWLGIALLGVVVLMAVVVPAEPLQVDQRWSEAMLDIRTRFLTDVALVFNWLGRGLGSAVTLAAVGIALVARRRWLALLAFGVTEAATTLSSTLLKILVGRPRPPDGLVHPVGSSFPSGHAAYGARPALRSSCCSAPGSRRRGWWALAVLGVLGMAWSRTYLQVHWLSDVVGGTLLGVGVALTVFAGTQSCCASQRNRRAAAFRAAFTEKLEDASTAGGRSAATRRGSRAGLGGVHGPEAATIAVNASEAPLPTMMAPARRRIVGQNFRYAIWPPSVALTVVAILAGGAGHAHLEQRGAGRGDRAEVQHEHRADCAVGNRDRAARVHRPGSGRDPARAAVWRKPVQPAPAALARRPLPRQWALGVSIAAFVYTLLVIGGISSERASSRIPELAVDVSILLVFAAIGTSLYLLHATAQTLRVA